MLTHHAIDKERGKSEDEERHNLQDNSNEYQTADELYDMMAKNRAFEGDGDNHQLTARDLVILYKNIDIGTKLLSTSKEETSRCSNQYVETIVYKDDNESAGSDVSENTSNEDLTDVFNMNKERIDLLHSYEDTLCHKFGNINMQTSDLTTEYGRHFLFNDSQIKEHIKGCHTISKAKLSDSTVLPASLLDYICCKRLENNFNFYMDNIIQYVQHTIDQLKRISNGDYLTEKAKEKWREVDRVNTQTLDCKDTILTSSTSIPLHVEGKNNGGESTWDDIVHSEMDVRSLSKILEKKIIIEVPKILCGSYTLFSKRCKDNLIITCKKDEPMIHKMNNEESRVDVVLKLQRSKSGHVVSNINSFMILKSLPTLKKTDPCINKMLALQENQIDSSLPESEQKAKIVELDENNEPFPKTSEVKEEPDAEILSETGYDVRPLDACIGNQYDSNHDEANFSLTGTDDLRRAIHRLNMQPPVIEETEENAKKKKSPTRVRIKSPYENQSHVLEEKKRKKLLEIREKREKKKIAMNERCKITKHKYGRGAIMPQSSNSVTKLSITNKSFYNSIYGQTGNQNLRKYQPRQKMDSIPGIELEDNDENSFRDTPLTTPEKNNVKYINRSYYLDDADTEIMHLQMKQNEKRDEANDNYTPSNSPISANDVGINFNLLRQLISQSTTDFSITDTSSSFQQNVLLDENFVNNSNNNMDIPKNNLKSSCSTQVIVPTNTPKKDEEITCRTTTSIQCRKSIDKIYQLMKKLDKTESDDTKSCNGSVGTDIKKIETIVGRGSSSIQASDSGTSIKQQLTSSNPSCFSFDKANNGIKTIKNTSISHEQSVPVISKVIISSKLQNKFSNKTNRENRKITSIKIQENPLKAISQLLHEFESVQKTRHKNGNESKRNKKADIMTEEKTNSRQVSFKRPNKQEQNLKESEMVSSRFSVRDRRRQSSANEPSKTSQQQFKSEENTSDKANRKIIADIIDEVKELRGEAVRGPSKKLSRLNSLAQPKKAYVQAHSEDVQNRFGKRILPERIHKPATPIITPERSMATTSLRNKQKKNPDFILSKPPNTTGSPLERLSRSKRSTNNSPSPEGSRKRSPVSVNKQTSNASEPQNGKMLAVETYVKSHYGRMSHTPGSSEARSAHKSRVPLIPTDIDLASLTSSRSTEESAVLGKKLHYMIDSMITTVPVLSALTECNESSSKVENIDPHFNCKKLTSHDDVALSGSDHPVDVFEDKNIITAVSSISKDNKDDDSLNDNYILDNCGDRQSPSNEFKKLESALYRQLSNGTFQKRLRIKNLTLTPKSSVENVFILQSGDVGSLLLKSTISQKLDTKSENVAELKILPVLSNTCIDFDFTKFPMHIATVGYAFPHHKARCDSTTKVCPAAEDDTKENEIKDSILCENDKSKPTFHKSIQCFKGEDNETAPLLMEHEEKVLSPCLNVNQTPENCEINVIEMQSIRERVDDIFVTDKNITDCSDIATNYKNNSTISNSTSLDILVGLLNEIKKITSCQAHLAARENACSIDLESKELEIILNRAAVQESSSVNNRVSVISLDNLQQLEARPSTYSLNASSKIEDITKTDQVVTTSTSLSYHTFGVDKDDNVRSFQKDYVHRFTEVPSDFFPITVSTNVTDSLMKFISKSSSSSQSIYPYYDCQTTHESVPKKIMEIPFKEAEKAIFNLNGENIKNKDKYITKSMARHDNNMTTLEFDSVMKMKRDILVTVYSILVLTVFAALSFPQIAY